MSDQPLPRIGDAERDRAAELLRDHLAEGRLDQSEFDDRVTRALTARTQAELDPLFSDLPGPRPGGSSVAPVFQAPPWQQPPGPIETVSSSAPVPARTGAPWGISSSAAWMIVVLALTFTNSWGNLWWLVFIPIFLSGGWGHQHRGRNRS